MREASLPSYTGDMDHGFPAPPADSLARVEEAYRAEKPRFMARLRKAGRSIQDAEDILHDAYAALLERSSLVPDIRSLPAWLNSLIGRRLVDAWRRDHVRGSAGETSVAQETLEEIVAEAGLDPQDSFVAESLVDALNDAIAALPAEQRRVIEAQVFGGQSFREIAQKTGECIDTLTARKRYALANLSRALRHWIEE
jgi:RNA polymerase sigma factor (sigma-70 family)